MTNLWEKNIVGVGSEVCNALTITHSLQITPTAIKNKPMRSSRCFLELFLIVLPVPGYFCFLDQKRWDFFLGKFYVQKTSPAQTTR